MSDREADAERGEAPRQAQPGSARPSRSTRSRAEAAANERTPLLRISPPSDPRRLPSSPSPSDPQPPRPTSKSQSRPKFARSRSTPRRGRRRAPPVHLFPAVFLLILCALGGIVAWDLTIGECRVQWICTLLGGREAYERVWERDTGAYAPWRSLGRSGVPRGCVVDQVSVLHRHTGRYPTQHAGHLLRTTLAKVANRLTRLPLHKPEFAFLPGADTSLTGWKLGELTDQGRVAAWESGKSYTRRYPDLELFVRTTDQSRVEETSRFWLEGYYRRAFNTTAPDERANVTMPEGKHANNTLSVHSCAAFESLHPRAGEKEYRKILAQLQPAADRLNGILSPQPALSAGDIVRLASMCGFDTTVSAPLGTQRWSPWCRVLTRSEWDIAGYVAEVERWYRVGEGGRYGRIMGAGWVNELLARLHDTAPQDGTTVNHTLDGNPATFPRGGHHLFVDFTHDNEMIEILAAMGVRKMRTKLPTHQLPQHLDDRRFNLAHLVPFGARWAVERIVCEAGGMGSTDIVSSTTASEYAEAAYEPRDLYKPSNSSVSAAYPTKGRRRKPRPKPTQPKNKAYVRILINDKPTHIDHMACRSSDYREHHMCHLSAFVQSQAWSREDVDWADCVSERG